ncbi:MAG TPA: hypothetical protein VI959_03955 [Alphaproteobacteria bacterium]|nr:hypothetical protein [Alphaproteobacteria bacterium]
MKNDSEKRRYDLIKNTALAFSYYEWGADFIDKGNRDQQIFDVLVGKVDTYSNAILNILKNVLNSCIVTLGAMTPFDSLYLNCAKDFISKNPNEQNTTRMC